MMGPWLFNDNGAVCVCVCVREQPVFYIVYICVCVVCVYMSLFVQCNTHSACLVVILHSQTDTIAGAYEPTNPDGCSQC